jgi:hypothetical protein
MQEHLDYLENVQPIRCPNPDALNSSFIECHRRVQALRALGEAVNGYGRVIAPKILRAFPDNICRRWIIHAKREGLSEGGILSLMTFWGRKWTRLSPPTRYVARRQTGAATPQPLQHFTYSRSLGIRPGGTPRGRSPFVCSANLATIGPRTAKGWRYR